MSDILLLATTTGYQIRSFGEAAAKLGVRLTFASDRCDQLDDPWCDQAIAVRFHDEPQSLDAVLAAVTSRTRPDGVIAVGDRPAVLGARIGEVLGLPGHPTLAVRSSRDKRATRQALKAAGLPTPSFADVSLDEDPQRLVAALSFPAVIKPAALSASRGVMRADTAEEFVQAFTRLRDLLQSTDIVNEHDPIHTRALIEAYIPGGELAIEGVMTHGAFRPFVLFDKPDPLVGPFFEETIYVTPSRESADVQREIVEHIAAAARALGLWHGPVHAECRVNSKGVYVLEVAARPIGGLCSRAVRFVSPDGSSASLEEVLIRHALGEDIAPFEVSERASGVMMIPIPKRGVFRRVTGLEQARAIPGVDDVRMTAKADEVLVPLPEGHSYLGFIFATGDRPGAVEQSLRDAHAQLTFVIDREIALAAV